MTGKRWGCCITGSRQPRTSAAGRARFRGHSVAAVLCLLAAPLVQAQQTAAANHSRVPSDLYFSAYIPSICFKFAGGPTDAFIYTGGIEYDRNGLNRHFSVAIYPFKELGKLIHARFDYAAEVTPLAILRQPTLTDNAGYALSSARKSVPGLAIEPFGFRMVWRGGKAIQPIWSLRFGGVVFTQKALSRNATYANMSGQTSLGTQIRLTPRADMRVGWELFHFSNGYVNGSNPGLDNLGVNFGIVYHLPRGGRW